MGKETAHRLVIGIDYGTTYTGVAFCHSSPNGPAVPDIHLITDWPGKHRNATEEKVPSEVAYHEGEFQWGNNIKSHLKREAWTKLLLDEAQKEQQLKLLRELLEGDSDEESFSVRALPKEPVDIVTDFLSGVRTHLQTVLEGRYGKMLNLLKREVVITVPAVWSDSAKALTYKAICNAGFNIPGTKISMITEPEAAAIYILRDLTDGPFSNIQKKDHFVVCDAGGGTVDIITYRVESINPFIIKEAVVGTGDKCGAVFVDREFKQWLRKKLGNERFQKIDPKRWNVGSRMMNEFEIAKVNFEGDDQESYIWMPDEIGPGNDPSVGIVDHEIRIQGEPMREIFDPCVNKILKLIDGQMQEVAPLKAKVKYILLAGGFGKSKYLFRRIRERYADQEIEVIRPGNPWSAVVRGAVREKVDPVGDSLVQLRLCRRHYGVSLLEPYDDTKHKEYKEREKLLDSKSGIVFAKGCMNWLAAKGDPIQSTSPKKATFEIPYLLTEGQPPVFNVKVFSWNDNKPPAKETETLSEICVLSFDLTKLPPEKLATRKLGDKAYKTVECRVEINIEGSLLEFRALVGDEEYCNVSRKEI